jgi:NAD(P)H-hydrate epimerase
MLSRAQVREIDRRAVEEYGVSGLVLMENAGRGVADMLCQWLPPRSPLTPHHSLLTLVCCGKGNNGGDGFVVARHLDLRGWPVKVLLFANPAQLTGDAAANYRILERSDIPIEVLKTTSDLARLDGELAAAEWIVDALLGTGATGEPRFPYDIAIDRINASGKPVCAVDLPSGLDCDTGDSAAHTIRAAHTCTFVAAKPGFLAVGADQFTGAVHVLDIGAPRKLVDEVQGK